MDNTLIINEIDLDIARDVCNDIKDLAIRNKAMANVFAAKFAKNCFSDDVEIDTVSGLHNIPSLFSRYDFSDIYIDSSRIEVRLYLEGEALTIPVAHYNNEIKPFAYMFIKVDTELTKGELTGFVLSDRVDYSNTNLEYCEIAETNLLTWEEISSLIEQEASIIDDEYSKDIEIKLFDLVDGNLDDAESNLLVQNLLSSKELRLKLIDIANTQYIFNYISNNSEEFGEDIDTTAVDEDSSQTLSLEELLLDDELRSNVSEINKEDENLIQDQSLDESINNKEINELFDSENNETDSVENFVNVSNRKKNLFILPLLLLLIIGGASYYAYTKIKPEESVKAMTPPSNKNIKQEETIIEKEKNKPIDMPVETVENIKTVTPANKEVAITPPIIPQNLGASVSISNLNINWDVPSGYTNNTTAQKYLIKIGKIIQLNLKAELLLLSKPIIANKISLELEFNKSSSKFKVKKVISSSGEKTVDDLIIKTVDGVLLMEQKVNMSVFETIVGNPILIIRL